jgi:hypothetical protein
MAGNHSFAQFVVRAHALSTAEPRTKPVFNVYTLARTATTGSPVKTDLMTKFKSFILTPLQACLSVSYVTDFLDMRWLDDPLDPFLEQALALNGTVAGDSLPSINNAVVNMRSPIRGGTYRGRKFYGPIAKGDTVLDHLTAGALVNWATFDAALLLGFTDATGFPWFPVVVSQKFSTFNPSTAVVFATAITSITTNTVLGELRRRSETRRSAA